MRALLAIVPVLLLAAACGGSGLHWDEGAARAPAVQLALPGSCAPSGQIYLVPIGDLRRVDPREVIARYHGEYGLALELLPAVAAGPEATDPSRHQLVAEALASALTRAQPALARDPEALLIGVTDEDMFIRAYDWRFAFSARFQRMAVVSTARMDPAFSGRPADPAATYARLYKMLTKNIGILYCGLSPSDNPRSVLHAPILSLGDLDTVDESIW